MLMWLLLVLVLFGGSRAYPRLPTFAKPLHYDVLINPNLETMKIEGKVEVDVILKQPTDFVKLHGSYMNITNVSYRFLNSKVDVNVTRIEEDKKYHFFTLKFPGIVQGGQRIILTIEYIATISDKLHGMYRNSYKDGGKTKHFLSTQFESTYARSVFPCWDEPLFKAQFTISVEVDAKLTALSNMPESHVKTSGSRKTVTFETTPLMSTYLIAMVVGDLEFLEGKSGNGPLVRVYTTPGKKHLARLALEYHLKAFSYYNQFFGYPYPLKKCDALALPDFASGAMENWGLITYRESSVIFNESSASIDVNRIAGNVIGHEVGHFWFGDLVTMKWWNDLWLKEGFATFLATQFVEDNYKDLGSWDDFLAKSLTAARDLDSLEHSHPIQVPLDDPGQLTLIYDAVTYKKSCHIIRMLYLYLGKEKFRLGLMKYVQEHQYSNAVTDDLWNAFSAVTDKDIKSLMSGWTGQIGYPVVALSSNPNGSLTVSQRRFLTKGVDDLAGTWQIPTNVLISKDNVDTRKSFLQREESGIIRSKIMLSADFVQLNPDSSGFFHVKYDDPKMFAKLVKAYGSKRIGHVNRYTVLTDSSYLVKSGLTPIGQLLDLINASSNENSSLVLSTVDSALTDIRNWLARSNNPAVLEKFNRFVVSTFRNASDVIGWTKKAHEQADVGSSRNTLKTIMVNAGDAETVAKAKKRFESGEYMPDLKLLVLKVIAGDGVSGLRQILSLYKSSNSANEKVDFQRALGSVTNHDALKELHEFMIDENNVRAQDFFRIVSFLGTTPEGQEATWRFVQENWQAIKSKYDSPVSREVINMLVHLLKRSSNLQINAEIRALFTDDQFKTIERNLGELQERIVINSQQERHHMTAIRAWLVENGFD